MIFMLFSKINKKKTQKPLKVVKTCFLIFERKIQYKTVEIDASFPKYILENKLKFKDWIA